MCELFYLCHHLDYGQLTYSRVICGGSSVTIPKLTTSIDFPKAYTSLNKPRALHVWKVKCSAGVFIRMYLWKGPSSEMRQCHFHFVFPLMPDKVVCVSTAHIWLQPLPGKPLYLCSKSASCWQRRNLHLQVCGKHWCLSTNINKSML